MLSSSQLAIAISATLTAAIVIGWILHWLWARAVNPAGGTAGRLAEMASNLHQNDAARHAAEEARALAETELAAKTSAFEEEIEAMRLRLNGAVEGREAALSQELHEARLDAEASMTGLGNARRRIAELEERIAELENSRGL
ncbi:MAG: hypothetical protein AAGC79_03015 [Pseudomonadota bacterium]